MTFVPSLMRAVFLTIVLVGLPVTPGWSDEAAWGDDAGERASSFLRESNLSLEVTRLPASAVEAFHLARGFSPAHAAMIAQRGCIHKLDAKNAAAPNENAVSLSLPLTAWRVHADGEESALLTRADWADIWDAASPPVAPAARTALHWAQFPPDQLFSPGDYNWGMASIGLPPGTRFELTVVWRENDREHRSTLKGLRCARIKP